MAPIAAAMPSQIQPVADHAADAADLDGSPAELRPAGVATQVVDMDVIVGNQNVQRRALAGVELDRIDVLGQRIGAGDRPRPVLFDHRHGRVPAARHHLRGDVNDPRRGQLSLTAVQQDFDQPGKRGGKLS
jgi:hypothetical protein